ncbi:MAG: hypothetical protein JNL01_10505 [Bdellovibrionales bacterium]|nr:hypothetical protein [Bdellovibrionales bacterium]
MGTLSVENLFTLSGFVLGWIFFLTLFFFGDRISRKGDWLVWIFMVVQMAFLILSWRVQIEAGWSVSHWALSWVDSANLDKAAGPMGPTIAFIRDPFQLAVWSLATIIFLLLLINQEILHFEERPEKSHASLILGFMGVLLCTSAANFWTLALGGSWVILSGWTAFSSNWELEREADLATRFIREKGIALGLLVVGAVMVHGSGIPLSWNKSLIQWLDSYPNAIAVKVGGVFLLMGTLFLSGGFPWLGWSQMNSRQSLVKRTLFGVVLPSLVAMMTLVRLDPLFRGIGVSHWMGWVCLSSAFLLALSAMSQLKKEAYFLQTMAAVLSLGMAGGFFSSAWITASILLGAYLIALAAAMVLSFSSVATAEPDSSRVSSETFSTVALFISGLLIAGFFGFVSSPGFLKSYLAILASDGWGAVAFFSVAHLMVAICGFRMNFGSKPAASGAPAPVYVKWMTALGPFYLFILGMAWIWTGAMTGEIVPGLMDQVSVSLLDQLFGQKSIQLDANSAEGMGVYWGVFVLSFAISYWMTRGNPDRFEKWVQSSPRFAGFISEQIGMDRLGNGLMNLLVRFGSAVENLIDGFLWKKSIPGATKWVLRILGQGFGRADSELRKRIEWSTARGFAGAAWAVQRIQGGKLQQYWYLSLFAGITLVVALIVTRGLL